MSIYLYFQNGAHVWLDRYRPLKDIALYIDLRCVCRYGGAPSNLQSVNIAVQKHQLRHNNDRSRHKVVTAFKWKQVADGVLKSTGSIFRYAAWSLIKFHFMFISV